MYCRNCFRKITDTSRFCRYCGAKVSETADAGKGKKRKLSMPSLAMIAATAVIAFAVVLVMVTQSSVFQKTESISYKDYIGVWQERGAADIEENGGVRLQIHGRDADTLIISMEFYGIAGSDIQVKELGAVIKDGKAYYSFTNDGFGNSGNGVLVFSGRDIDWQSTVNKNDSVVYTVSKVTAGEDGTEITDQEQETQQETPSAEPDVKKYILPDSDKQLLTEDEIKKLTQEELRIARNEIMARHGRIFRDPTLDAYFRSKDWYKPELEPDEFDSQSGKILSNIEMKNITIIKQMEE